MHCPLKIISAFNDFRGMHAWDCASNLSCLWILARVVSWTSHGGRSPFGRQWTKIVSVPIHSATGQHAWTCGAAEEPTEQGDIDSQHGLISLLAAFRGRWWARGGRGNEVLGWRLASLPFVANLIYITIVVMNLHQMAQNYKSPVGDSFCAQRDVKC
jgi:hypothetical protein